MIRKILIFTVLAVAATAAIVLPLWKSDAAQQRTSIRIPTRSALPNFDIRLTDVASLMTWTLAQLPASKLLQNARTRSRASAVEQFRSSLRAEKAANLRAVVNEAGAMKNFFIDGGTLSEPQSDTADNVARNFLARITHSSRFRAPASKS